jgi:hypothetical protein
MAGVKVLVLGNDPNINSIDFSKLDPSVITLGVNRIWLKHIPTYFFFNDIQIATELQAQPEILAQLKEKSICYSSDWLAVNNPKLTPPNWTTIYNRPEPRSFPDSVSTAVSIFNTQFLQNKDITFYIAGVSLRWMEPSHFWKMENYESLNKHNQDWYNPRFAAILRNIARMRATGTKMISVTPNSMLNKVMRYEKIENLYR